MFASSTPWGVWTVIMERMHQLEPRLRAFWEGFPCPPPWKEELFFRLNWTGCVGPEVGERVKWFMADKCNIRLGGGSPFPGNKGIGTDADEDDGVMVEEGCGLTCQIIVALFSVLFFVILFIIVIHCVRRKRAKAASPSHQSSLTAHADGNAKYYTTCHYASAPVVTRHLQTNITRNGTETRLVDSSDNSSLYQPGCYPQHGCQQSPLSYHHIQQHLHHRHHPHPQHHHLQQMPRLINTPYGQVPAHTSSLIVPHTSRFNISHYRKFDPAYSSPSVTNSDRSPVYESIDDADSIRERTRGSNCGGRDTSVSECEYCECSCGEHGNDHGFYSEYHDLEGRNPSDSDTYTDKLGTSGFPPDIEPPCPPLCSDGYYGDRHSQTLPLRPIRGHPVNKGNNHNNEAELSALDFNELSPLNQSQDQLGSTGTADSRDTNGNGANKNEHRVGGVRRNPSIGSSYSANGGSHYAEGNYSNGQRRPIPALHPNYFVSNQEEIS